MKGQGVCFQIKSSLLLPCLLPSLSAFPSLMSTLKSLPLILNNKRQQNKTLLLLLPPPATMLSLSFLSQLSHLKEPPIHGSAHCNLALPFCQEPKVAASTVVVTLLWPEPVDTVLLPFPLFAGPDTTCPFSFPCPAPACSRVCFSTCWRLSHRLQCPGSPWSLDWCVGFLLCVFA